VTAAAAAAAARDEVAVAAAYDGAVGVLCGCWAARWGWCLGGMMTEICFNDLTVRVGVATIAVEVKGLETVTVTVFGLTEMYVHWKPGFRIKLEASLSASLSTDANTRQHLGLGL